MQDILNVELSAHGIKYFNYLYVSDRGDCNLFASNAGVIQYLFDNNIPVAAPVCPTMLSEKFNHMILPEGLYNEAVHHAKSYFNLGNFVNLVERHEGFIELMCFASEANNNEIINFYLNRINILENFRRSFKEKAKDILKRTKNNSLVLNSTMMPSYKGVKKKKIEFTPREKECIQLLIRGKTAKQIGRTLHLSNRTIEFYLANIKSKLGISSKSALIEYGFNNKF